MIRLAAMACGLICGVGVLLSGLYRPAAGWEAGLGLGLGAALVVAAVLFAVTAGLARPLLGGEMEPATGAGGWKPLVGGLIFGLGWGLAGYFPMAALVALGTFGPGAGIFLASVLAGMILRDIVAGGGRLNLQRLRSQG